MNKYRGTMAGDENPLISCPRTPATGLRDNDLRLRLNELGPAMAGSTPKKTGLEGRRYSVTNQTVSMTPLEDNQHMATDEQGNAWHVVTSKKIRTAKSREQNQLADPIRSQYNKKGWRREGGIMVHRDGRWRYMDDQEIQQYKYMDQARPTVTRPSRRTIPESSPPKQATATTGSGVVRDKPAGQQTVKATATIGSGQARAKPAGQQTDNKKRFTSGTKEPHGSFAKKSNTGGTTQPEQGYVRFTRGPEFWNLTANRIRTARIVPEDPTLAGSTFEDSDINHISHYFTLAKIADFKGDQTMCKLVAQDGMGISFGVIRMRMMDSRGIDWWRSFTATVPPRVTGPDGEPGTRYKFIPPGEDEETVYRVNIKDSTLANPNKQMALDHLMAEWKGVDNPILQAKFRIKIGEVVQRTGATAVWLYMKNGHHEDILEAMNYEITYGLENYSITRASKKPILETEMGDKSKSEEAYDDEIQVLSEQQTAKSWCNRRRR